MASMASSYSNINHAFLSYKQYKKQENLSPYEKPPFVSLIIPAHNEEYTIAQTVTSISQIDYTLNGKPNFELIVCK